MSDNMMNKAQILNDYVRLMNKAQTYKRLFELLNDYVRQDIPYIPYNNTKEQIKAILIFLEEYENEITYKTRKDTSL